MFEHNIQFCACFLKLPCHLMNPTTFIMLSLANNNNNNKSDVFINGKVKAKLSNNKNIYKKRKFSKRIN